MTIDALKSALAGCASPETAIAAILAHHPEWRAPVPIEAFAQSVGIAEIRDHAADGIASGLLTDIDKRRGVILCAPGLNAQRRRFAIAHELGHFLLVAHRGDRSCTNRDLAEIRRDTAHRKEEMQANRFAAGLLMPKPWFTVLVDDLGKPTVAHLPTIAAAYAVSLEAAASRYADLSQAMCAFLFVKDGLFRYARPSRSFPPLAIPSGAPVPAAVRAARPTDRIAWAPADPREWLTLPRDARPPKLTVQVLSKDNGFQLVMLSINAAAERRADEEEEKSATESPKFGRPRSR
jgi:Zn-dependent peptidase ImmA (M78 family)